MKSIRFLTPTMHGALDYFAATGLMVLPFVLGLDGPALWLSVLGGIGLIAYSLLTDYALSAASVFSFKTHLVLDLAAAAVFISAPLVFGWAGIVMGYYFVMAAGVIVVVVLSDPNSVPVAGSAASAAG